METKSRIIGLTALTCIGMLAAQGAAAHQAGKAGAGYVGENDSHLMYRASTLSVIQTAPAPQTTTRSYHCAAPLRSKIT